MMRWLRSSVLVAILLGSSWLLLASSAAAGDGEGIAAPSLANAAGEEAGKALDDPSGKGKEPGPAGDPGDRGEILQLLSLYAHLFDEVGAEEWSELFVEDAVFEIVFDGPKGEQEQVVASRWRGRAAILEAMAPRRAAFEAKGIQRRHYLSNPVVFDLTQDSARVAVYLLLRTIDAEGTHALVGTGRSLGRVVKRPAGWRISHWRMEADGPAVGMTRGEDPG